MNSNYLVKVMSYQEMSLNGMKLAMDVNGGSGVTCAASQQEDHGLTVSGEVEKV